MGRRPNKALAPVTDTELRAWLRQHLGVTIPDVQVCPNHSTPWRAFWDAFNGDHLVSVWKASRGMGGKTFLLSVLGDAEVVKLGADVTILGGSGEQSERVQEYISDWLKREPDGRVTKDNARDAELANGGRLRALMASSKSVRGPHPQRLRVDEADEVAFSLVKSALGQPMTGRGIKEQTVLSSTHQYADGTMTKLIQMARENPAWSYHEWCVVGNSDIMTPAGAKKMFDIRPGASVYAHVRGQIIETKVTDWWSNGERSTLIIETSLGTIQCTPEHRILTGGGWKAAESLSEGDQVFGVRQAVASARQMGEECSANMLELPAPRNGSEASQPVIEMPVVRQVETEAFQDMPGVLSPFNGKSECDSGGRTCVSQTTYRPIRHQPQAHQQERSSSAGAISGFGDSVRGRAGFRAGRGGFRIAEVRVGSRDQRPLLAQPGEAEGAGCAKGPGGGAGWPSTTGALGRRTPSLAVAIVENIRPGPVETVYDLTVVQGESFVCDNLVVHNCYRESMAGDGAWLSQEQVANKQATMTTDTWQTEVEGQEPNPENRAIQPDKVAAMFDPVLGEFDGREAEYIEIEPPLPGAKYVHGADWARKVDWTVIVTLRIDVYPYRLVAFERTGRRPWPDMIGKFDARIARYGGMAWHDGTGVGDVVGGYLTKPAVGVMMVGRARADMLTTYITGVERGMVRAPMIKWMNGEHKLASVRDVYGSGSDVTGADTAFHLPDTIAAMALAWIGAPKLFQGSATAWLGALRAAEQGGQPAPLPAVESLGGMPLVPGAMDQRPQRLG